VVHNPQSRSIPALFIPRTSPKLMLYFHGNAEDIHIAQHQMYTIANYLNVSVLGMEYPGYGLY